MATEVPHPRPRCPAGESPSLCLTDRLAVELHGRQEAFAAQGRDALDQFFDVGIVNVQSARVGGGVGKIVTASAAAAFGEGDVMRRSLDRQIAAILAML